MLPNINLEILRDMYTNNSQTVYELNQVQPVLLVFLRDFGCSFCREALSDIAQKRTIIESNGVKIVFVHMSTEPVAEKYFKKYKLYNIAHVSNPSCSYYLNFGLGKATYTQLMGMKNWYRGFEAGVLEGHGAAFFLGDGFQMPGVFMLQDSEIKDYFIHQYTSDRPDYYALAKCCIVSTTAA